MALKLVVRGPEAGPFLTHATDLSTHGCRLEACACLTCGDTVTLELPECEPCRAKVTWARGPAAGVEFENPISKDVLLQLVTSCAPSHQL